jgi:phosphinothricin acetyltransferase
MDIISKPFEPEDWIPVAEIYKQGIESGNATFEKEVPTWDSWDSGHIKKCRIVACFNNEIIGWAVLTQVSRRCVYAGVAEVSVYVANQYKRLYVIHNLVYVWSFLFVYTKFISEI